MLRRRLPWDYGVRNLFRRPSRSALTLAGLSVVVLLVLVVVGFIRGLEASLAATGQPNVVLVYALSSGADIENSAVPARTPALLAASVGGVREQHGVQFVSPELYLGTRIKVARQAKSGLGLVRGVTTTAPLVRQQVQIVEGKWPGPGEVLVGRLAHSKLGCDKQALAIGQSVEFDGRAWKVCGAFVAGGAAYESEIWCQLEDLQGALKRQDLSLVAVAMQSADAAIRRRFILPRAHRPGAQSRAGSRLLCGSAEALPAGAHARLDGSLPGCRLGVFAGLNTMYGAVVGRVRELATLQAIGFRRRAILLTLIQEATLLSCCGALVACVVALMFINGTAVRFTMGAFMLRIDSFAVLIACATAISLGIVGAIPPATKAMRLPVVEAIKAI